MSFIESLSNIAYTRLTRISVDIGSHLLVDHRIIIPGDEGVVLIDRHLFWDFFASISKIRFLRAKH